MTASPTCRCRRADCCLPARTPISTLDGQEYGWRAGLAYEIPEYKLRAQILYRSGTDYGATGTLTVPGALVGSPVPSVTLPAAGIGQLPQSVEVSFRSGVAPAWLVFGSVKWTDWSVLQNLTVIIADLDRSSISISGATAGR